MPEAKKESSKRSKAGSSRADFSRRDFIKGGVVAGLAGGVGLGAGYFGYQKLRDPVRVGIIGTGDEGGVLIGALNPDFVDVVAIADIRPYNIHRAFHGDESSENALKHRSGLMRKYGWPNETVARQHVAVYDDKYEDLLADANVEAVIIALPLHLHAEASIKAMRAEKHVLSEKLMAKSVHQCKEMARVTKETDKLLAVGHQRHYSVLYDNAVQAIKRGLIGDVHHIRAQWHRGNLPGNDSWQQALPDDKMMEELDKLAQSSAADVAALVAMRATDADAWDGGLSAGRDKAEKNRRLKKLRLLDAEVDAKKYGYVDRMVGGRKVSALEELIRWRLWNRTGGGLMAELGSHQLDAASIFISALRDDGKKVHPLTVYGVGGRHIFPHDRDVGDHVYCAFEFPGPEYYADFDARNVKDENKKVVVTYSSINGNGFGGYGEVVMGTQGTMIVYREKELLFDGIGGGQTSVTAAKAGGGPTLDTTESGAPTAATSQGTGPVSRGYTEEIEHLAWCIRNPAPENQPRCNPEVALADAVMALVANRAIEEERQIPFRPEWFKIDSDETPEGVKPDVNRKEYEL